MLNKNIAFLLLFLLTLLIVIIYFFIKDVSKTKTITLSINNIKVTAEVADTPLKKQKGLSGRNFLAEDEGMLFPYDTYSKHTFWMGGMRIPLDFIWIKDNEIVQISENVPAPKNLLDQPVVLIPSTDVNSVLEVNAGFVRKNKIKVGEKVILQK